MDEKTTKAILTVAVVGILLYFVVLRPKATATKALAPKTAGPGTSFTQEVNAFSQFVGSLGGLFKSGSSAPVPSSTTGPVQPIVNEGTFDQGPSHVEDNTLVDDSGATLTYGTD
jgi:hypothetical protein